MLTTLDQNDIPSIKTEILGPKSQSLIREQQKLESSSVIYPPYFPMATRDARNSLTNDSKKIDSDLILNVRGKVFMYGIEVGSKTGTPIDSVEMGKIELELLRNGLMMHSCGHFGNVLRFIGALTIEDQSIDKRVEIVENVLKKHSQKEV